MASSPARPDLSVVILVYNHQATLRQCIDSVLAQETSYRLAIHCVDDASTDGSGAILAEYAAAHPGKITVHTCDRNQGSGKGALYHTRPQVDGRYWSIVDGDDYWSDPQRAQLQLDFLEANPRFAGCSGNTLMRDEVAGTETLIRPAREDWNIYDLVLMTRYFSLYVHPSSIVWRNLHLHAGFFMPPEYAAPHGRGDVVLKVMMLAGGGLMHNIDRVFSCYRVTGQGAWSSKTEAEKEKFTRELGGYVRKSYGRKVRFFVLLWRATALLRPLHRILPGPINEFR